MSVILSIWMSEREAVVNPDAICYLLSAAEMKQGLHAAMHVCSQASWPFYSVLIYAVTAVTHGTYETSAYILDGFFSLLSVIAFLAITRFLTQNFRILCLAAVVILLSHEFNAVRQYIVRDHGFWAFYLVSIFFLLKYFRDTRWRYALLWAVSLIVATLFRVEGAVFLVLVPVVSLFDKRHLVAARIKHFIQLNTLTILLAVCLVVSVCLLPHLELTRLNELSNQLISGVSDIGHRFATMRQVVVGQLIPDSKGDAGIVIFLMLFSWYVYSIMTNLSFIYSAIVVYAWSKRLMTVDSYARLILWGYIIVNLVITAAFLAEHLFLSKRYLIALSLVLMLWVPFALDKLLSDWKSKKLSIVVVIVFMAASAVGGIFDFGYSKKYIHDAGDWLQNNVRQTSSLYSNDYQVMYYSHHFGTQIFEKAQTYIAMQPRIDQKCEYVALRVNKKDQVSQANLLKYNQIQVFANKRGDQVRIYRRKHP